MPITWASSCWEEAAPGARSGAGSQYRGMRGGGDGGRMLQAGEHMQEWSVGWEMCGFQSRERTVNRVDFFQGRV